MTDSSSAIDYPVYLGIWTNWSLGGRISGSVLTLNHRNGALLTAFLALFITFTGSRFWRIACFVLHQVSSSHSGPQDGLYHQCQATLRNSIDEKNAFVKFSCILWTWRSKASRPFSRALPLVIFSAFITALLTFGTLFSSKLGSSMGSEVLISSSQCGTIMMYSETSTALLQASVYNPWLSQRTISYSNYAQRCYTNTSKAGDCRGPFVKKALPSVVDRNASCPFKNNICRNSTGNIKIDTGYLNSQAELGLNTPLESQFALRVLTQCAPLKAEGYKKIVHYSDDKLYTQYFYGSRFGNVTEDNRTFTYQMEQQSINQWKWEGDFEPSSEYQIG